ncbi:unnamed protein product [Aspergillus oryzae]|uniref:Unnamed protein product n=1 Tax=Aspergillus oryzae TaxID=5062 RepID=A0AAN4YXG1_ASPOZ|nr:unnamed protein product [Aspergillus oryzae]GMF97052.1 unnamed protein product [Aspergillus oryzae]GMG14782.1 unnamed protein product [Aspergillus oryzae]GMG36073.1 unnamed protein product [Aspergillus oryzae]
MRKPYTHHRSRCKGSSFGIVLHDHVNPRKQDGGNARGHPQKIIGREMKPNWNVPHKKNDIAEEKNCGGGREGGPDRVDHAKRGRKDACHYSDSLNTSWNRIDLWDGISAVLLRLVFQPQGHLPANIAGTLKAGDYLKSQSGPAQQYA